MREKNPLIEIPLFDGVDLKTITNVWSAGNVHKYPKGIVLIRGKEPVSNVYIQLSGKTIQYNLTQNGRRKILFVFGKNMLLNEHVFNHHLTSIYCETIEKSEVFEIPVAEFIKQMSVDFKLAENVLETQERKMWRLSHQLKNTMSSIYLERKLASKLWKLCRDFGIDKDYGREIDINMSITFLADMLGVSRETTSRVCSTLVEQGLIKINKKRIVVVNLEGLRNFYRTGKIE